MILLSQVAQAVGGTLNGLDAECVAVKMDSRSIQENDFFVAIPGEKYDGHDYVQAAAQNGAVGAMVSTLQNTQVTQILVEDTTKALGLLGKYWRACFDIPVIAITGSNGKTTVTALISSILNMTGCCLSPKGSFNNQWGVPLTLLELRETHDYIVVEMGMNHSGELDYLSNLTTPDVALINNAAPAHLEGLGSVEKIAEAKGEIFNGLTTEGTAILNADDDFCEYWKKDLLVQNSDRRILTFGRHRDADVVMSNLTLQESGSSFDLKIDQQTINVEIPLLGEHNAMNAAAAACAVYAIGLNPMQIREGLKQGRAVAGRLTMRKGLRGSLVVDDSYNANPSSMKVAIDVLSNTRQRGILVLGEMAELGVNSHELHHEIGKYAKDSGIAKFYCLSEKDTAASSHYVDGYGKDGNRFTSLEKLVEELKAELDQNVLVMIKGSRSSGMERVVNEITNVESNCGGALC